MSGIVEPDDDLLCEMAEEICNCKAATAERAKKNIETRIQSILGDGAIKRGFHYKLDDETIECIRTICTGIVQQNFDKVTLYDRYGDVIKLVRDGNAVKVRRISKCQMEL